MARVDIDVDETDLHNVKATLRLELEETDAAVQQVISRYAFLIARDAKKNAPVDTGRLRASIHPVLKKLADLTADIIGGGDDIISTGVDYAAVQEFGSSEQNIEGKRYMTRAYKKHKEDFVREVKAAAGRFGK